MPSELQHIKMSTRQAGRSYGELLRTQDLRLGSEYSMRVLASKSSLDRRETEPKERLVTLISPLFPKRVPYENPFLIIELVMLLTPVALLPVCVSAGTVARALGNVCYVARMGRL